jgi:hypothetical protein
MRMTLARVLHYCFHANRQAQANLPASQNAGKKKTGKR